MKLETASILIGGNYYDDFPVKHDGDDADSLLSAWTALWHPAVISQVRQVPNWTRVDDLPDSIENHLLLVPSVTEPELDDRFRRRVESQEVLLITETRSRNQLLDALLPRIYGDAIPTIDDSLVADFYALGYCYLQIELLTRHMRYTSGVAESDFHLSLIAAADAAMTATDDPDHAQKVEELLRACFDQLTQERDHYYAVEVYLLDFALWVKQLPHTALEQQLSSPVPFNLMMPGESVASIPDHLKEQIKHAIEKGSVSIVGGEFRELQLPLLAGETILREFQRGQREFKNHFGRESRVFGRRRFGLATTLPQILAKQNYLGVLHATFDDGKFPEANQTKSRWEGNDGSNLDAIMRAPLDATRSATFLNLSGNISDSMDVDHVATRCFVHWAGDVSPWMEELRRISKFTNALGRFVTAEEYFQEPFSSSMQDKFKLSKYRSPYLEQSIANNESDPISTHVRYWRRFAQIQQVEALAIISQLASRSKDANESFADSQRLREQQQSLLGQEDKEFDATLSQAATNLTRSIASSLLPKAKAGQSHATKGIFAVNGFSFPIRVYASGTELSRLPSEIKPVYASDENAKSVAFDVPAMGFAWIAGGQNAADIKSGTKKHAINTNVAEENALRNEFFEAQVDPQTGGLRLIRDFNERTSRLSQQLAFRLKASVPRETDDLTFSSMYTRMVAEEVAVTRSNSMFGQIRSRGKLMDGKEVVATFQQTFTVKRGSRVLHLETEIETLREPGDQPWHSYFGHRFAWPNEAASLVTSTNDVGITNDARRLESPRFINIDDVKRNTTILTGGHPFHTRVGGRMLDSILVVQGESRRRFAMGIGVELRNPFRAASEFLVDRKPFGNPESVESTSFEMTGPDETVTGWFFHLDAKNVIVTSWEPIVVENVLVGIRIRIIETERKSADVTLSTFRDVVSARKTDFQSETVDQCSIDANRISMKIRGHEWAQVEVLFQNTGLEQVASSGAAADANAERNQEGSGQ